MITDIEHDEIFRIALKSLFSRKSVDSDKALADPMNVVDGMEIGTLKNILSRTTRHLNSGKAELFDEVTGEEYIPQISIEFPYWQNEPSSRNDLKESLFETIQHDAQTIMILGYRFHNGIEEKSYGHWTVVNSVTEKNLITYDSSNEKSRIPWEKVLITDSDNPVQQHTTRPYIIRPRDIVIISNNQ